MATQKLSYDEWCKRYSRQSSSEDTKELNHLHNVDMQKEIDAALRKEYDFYANGGFDNV